MPYKMRSELKIDGHEYEVVIAEKLLTLGQFKLLILSNS